MKTLSYKIANEYNGTVLDLFEKGLSFQLFIKAGRWPPLGILNNFFAYGCDDMECGQILEWEPFILSHHDYLAIQKQFTQRGREIRIDSFRLKNANYEKWFAKLVKFSHGQSQRCQ